MRWIATEAIVKLSGPLLAALALAACCPSLVHGITITIDYSLDTNKFFNTQAKKDILQATADTYATKLTDNLTAITPGGGNTWQEVFYNPSTGNVQTITDPTVPVNTVVIYAGAQNLPGTILGEGATGSYNNVSGSLDFVTAVSTRGQGNTRGPTANDYGPWGGAIYFTDNPAVSWDFSNSPPTGGQYDFFTAAEHEIAHVLGFGESDSWRRLVSGSTFVGPHATAAHGGVNVPLSTPDLAHWATGTTSDGHLATMDPTLALGVRSALTTLDLAGLQDIGWTLAPPGIPGDVTHDGIVNAQDIALVASHWLTVGPYGDANHDGIVNGQDIAIIAAHWLATGGGGSAVPEPSTIVLITMAAAAVPLLRRNSRRRR
jgi:hypothetical protein